MHSIDQMFNEAFQPFRHDKGTAYPTRQSDIDFHNNGSFTARNRGPFLTEADTTEYMMKHNTLTKRPRTSEQAAMDRLANALRDYRNGHKLGPDFAIKAFSDLDLVFFGGHLTANVCVSWSSNETDIRLEAPTCHHKEGLQAVILGVTERRRRCGERGQCRIVLNAETLFSRTAPWEPVERMIGVLLHEMVHAYDHVRCPDAQELDGDGRRHDAHFETRISVVHERAVRLLGLRVIEEDERYRQKIFFKKDLGSRREGGRRHRSRW